MFIVLLYTLDKHSCPLFIYSCTLSWYFNDLKSIVSKARGCASSHHLSLVSSLRSLSWTFDNGLVTNLCIRNKEKALTVHIEHAFQ